MQALIDAEKSGIIKSGKISLVVSDKEGVFALERAKNASIPSMVFPKKEYSNSNSLCDAICDTLVSEKIDVVVLAGFLSILSGKILKVYENKIINVHPSLIPSFCGDGFYGLRVHKAALDYGVKVTGATVHFVNEITDGGKIICQKCVEIKKGDTPEILQRRVMEEAEWQILPKACEMVCAGEV